MSEETTRRDEWIRWVNANRGRYKAMALFAVWKDGGDKMLSEVLKKLKLEKTMDLVRELGNE